MGCGLLCIFHYITFFIGILSLPVYILVLVVLIRYRKQFKSGFFTCFISTGAADIIALTITRSFRILPKYFFPGFALASNWVAVLHRILEWWSYYTQSFGVLLLSINRLLAVVRPMQYDTDWTQNVSIGAIILQWCLPLLFVISMVHPNVCCHYDETMTVQFNIYEAHKAYYGVAVFVDFFILIPSFVGIYATIVWNLVKTRMKRKNNPSSRRQSHKRYREAKLALTGAIISALFIFMSTIDIVGFLGPIPRWYWEMFWVAQDLFTYCNPYLLLMLSTQVRQRFTNMICGLNRVAPVVPNVAFRQNGSNMSPISRFQPPNDQNQIGSNISSGRI